MSWFAVTITANTVLEPFPVTVTASCGLELITSSPRDIELGLARHERDFFSSSLNWNGKPKKAFPVLGTGAENIRNPSRSLEREWENLNFIPIKQDGNRKFENA